MEKNTYHHGNLRSAVLAAALTRLISEGPEKLSLRGLARDVGVSATALYRHFSDKDTLLVTLAKEGFDCLTKAVIAAQQQADGPAESLLAAGQAYVEFALTHPQQYRLMFGRYFCGENTDPPEALDTAANQAYQVLVSIIEQGIAAKQFTAKPAKMHAVAAWSMVHGLASLLIDGLLTNSPGKAINLSQEELGSYIEAATETFLHGMMVKLS
ncbi:WHG domain-containing protein [Endozoicomonas sp. SM1973]|uniref:WHG domain-containing protein n=1 Tax=Spartinivicinus marinus TaxID=2994442 RepID=A0A853IEU1_9GAMM|nr:TetR/AcrR family transcriptional regulator [Spartinivicinus marinus]MCX4025275.1 TetR/AcrR family transcriptional regulator [Spartinivicinus marinus]NYZ65996.1 WHG domain-containing protein [Spartinivicinus marinus]